MPFVATHGMAKTPEYGTWKRMKNRCYNPNYPMFRHYGGRGITVCDRWLDNFENFYNDMGAKPKGYSLDRVDNNGNYTPENCRWATNAEQAKNKQATRYYTFKGKRMVATEIAKEIGMKPTTMYQRLFVMKWPMERIINTPVRFNRRKKI